MSRKYHYTGYWRVWSRRLGVVDEYIIDLDLEPISGWSHGDKNVVLRENIRAHLTCDMPMDKNDDILPQQTMHDLLANVGEDLFERLLNFDYLAEVSLEDILAAPSNGGSAYADIVAVRDKRTGVTGQAIKIRRHERDMIEHYGVQIYSELHQDLVNASNREDRFTLQSIAFARLQGFGEAMEEVMPWPVDKTRKGHVIGRLWQSIGMKPDLNPYMTKLEGVDCLFDTIDGDE